MERIIIQNKIDIVNMLMDVRRDLGSIRRTEFDLPPVTELSAIKGISFNIEQEARLKEIGALSACPKWEYGYFRSNKNNAKVNNNLLAADKVLAEIFSYIKNCRISPRAFRFSEMEMSRFEVINGSMRNSWLVECLKEGVING